LKIFALLTVPEGDQPEAGWPAIVFNHGYIPPAEYRTTERYVAYTDAFSRNGYVLIKPDYRGHGQSEGNAAGGYGSNAYTVDVLNALASVKKYPGVNPQKIGMWGHSMGGFITLRAMVVDPDIKAGVIWAGVVASYPDLLYSWRRRSFPIPSTVPSGARRWRDQLIDKFGTPEKNPGFWNSISANSYLDNISGPLQLHHGTADESVPVEFSAKLAKQMADAKKSAEIFTYEGDDHNISANFNTAMERSVAFFDRNLKE
jgi:dipeptidyl aminopeptidase/acylaminoacyl peptidase